MEHANLGNLFDFIKASNNLSYSTIRIIMKQLLLGLNYLHSKGIIHRDIKGQNIMLHSPPGCGIVFVKIGDYGEVKISEQNPFLSMTMSYKGTYGFMAPELFIPIVDAPKVSDENGQM
ncbi:MAG: hypothetical protein EZS28_053138, partial [Streblomastix strix]